MNFTALKAELAARGFDDMTDARLGTTINRARAWLDDYTLWPYREKSATGTPAPLIISDLGVVKVVLDMSTALPLQPANYLWLSASYGDLATAGDPVFWYLASPEAVQQVATYPVSSSREIGVEYYCVPPDLSSGTDSPISPARFHQLIVDLAVQFAYRDTDNHQAADALGVQIDRDLQVMVNALMQGQVQGAAQFVWSRGVNY